MKLLALDPTKRLGAGSYEEGTDYEGLRSHAYFEGIDFGCVFDKQENQIETGIDEDKPDIDNNFLRRGSSNNQPKPLREGGERMDKIKLERKRTIMKLKKQKEDYIVFEGLLKKKRHWKK